MFTKLLVPLDNSPLAEQAIPTAQALARFAGATIDLVYVHQPQPFAGYADAPWNAARRSSEESYVCAIADEIRSATTVPVQGSLATGTPADGICTCADDAEADLIVMTTHGRTGLSRAWLGSVADAVVRQTQIPVLLLRAADPKSCANTERCAFKRVLVPIDGSTASETILAPAASLAAADGGRLIVVEVVPPIPLIIADVTAPYGFGATVMDPDATDAVVRATSLRLQEVADRLRRLGVRDVETDVIVNESPAQAILEAARAHSADVVAMTTSGRGASRVVVGSVADRVMRASQLPLLLCRPSRSGNLESAALQSNAHVAFTIA